LEANGLNNRRKAFQVEVRQNETGMNITNRWSSRLEGRLEPSAQTRKEDRSLGVVGGAAQLYVMFFKMRYFLIVEKLFVATLKANK
jgi:hypothetical protein